jgi:hypothetical protein
LWLYPYNKYNPSIIHVMPVKKLSVIIKTMKENTQLAFSWKRAVELIALTLYVIMIFYGDIQRERAKYALQIDLPQLCNNSGQTFVLRKWFFQLPWQFSQWSVFCTPPFKDEQGNELRFLDSSVVIDLTDCSIGWKMMHDDNHFFEIMTALYEKQNFPIINADPRYLMPACP